MLRGLIGDVEDSRLQPQERQRRAGEEGAFGTGDEEEVGFAGRRGLPLLVLESLLLPRLGGGEAAAAAAAVLAAPFRRRRGGGRDDFGRGSGGCHSCTSRSCSLSSFLGSEDEGAFFCFCGEGFERERERKEKKKGGVGVSHSVKEEGTEWRRTTDSQNVKFRRGRRAVTPALWIQSEAMRS